MGIARVAAEAANRARDLQNMPANVADPAYLADRAREIAAAHASVEVEVLDRARLEAEGMGGILAVSAGSAKEPALIVLRLLRRRRAQARPRRQGRHLRQRRDLDQAGRRHGADEEGHVREAPRCSRRPRRSPSSASPVDLVSVVPAVENMPSGTAMRPGDIITQLNGKTVEVNNTDAEGRLILADALTFCARQGAERIVDVATLTGAVVVALGSTYAAMISNDDDWAAEVTRGRRRHRRTALAAAAAPRVQAADQGHGRPT